MKALARGILAIVLAVMVGCGVLMFHEPTRYVSSSPDGRWRVRVTERACLADCVVRIYADGGLIPIPIGVGNDCWIEFVHTTWIKSTAVVFVDGGVCPDIKVAYDFDHRSFVEYSLFEPQLNDDIVRAWEVTDAELEACGGDALQWASSRSECGGGRARVEFLRKYPAAGLF
jgi:hypothetical protein